MFDRVFVTHVTVVTRLGARAVMKYLETQVEVPQIGWPSGNLPFEGIIKDREFRIRRATPFLGTPFPPIIKGRIDSDSQNQTVISIEIRPMTYLGAFLILWPTIAFLMLCNVIWRTIGSSDLWYSMPFLFCFIIFISLTYSALLTAFMKEVELSKKLLSDLFTDIGKLYYGRYYREAEHETHS